MRDIYKILFKQGFLPDEVKIQDPVLLFDIFGEEETEEIPQGYEWFYGM